MGWKLSTHNGTVTMVSPKTGSHRTVKIATQPKDSRFAPGKRVAYMRVGEENGLEWLGFGFVENGRIRVWKSRQAEGNFFPTLANMVEQPSKWMAKGVEYKAAGKCRVCNRELTNPESIDLGIGPICRGG